MTSKMSVVSGMDPRFCELELSQAIASRDRDQQFESASLHLPSDGIRASVGDQR